MRNSYTDLLPTERKRALRREYFLRLAVVGMFAATALVLIYGVLLVPTYLFLSSTAKTKSARLAELQRSLASSDESQLSARLEALSKDAGTLLALGSEPSVTGQFSALLAIARPGITLSQISYAPPSSSSAGQIIVSGIAATRDSLRQYQIAIQAAPFASSVDLPVSVYAKDSAIPFSITITLKNP